nr:hypothetical protein [Nodaviridae sp.]
MYHSNIYTSVVDGTTSGGISQNIAAAVLHQYSYLATRLMINLGEREIIAIVPKNVLGELIECEDHTHIQYYKWRDYVVLPVFHPTYLHTLEEKEQMDYVVRNLRNMQFRRIVLHGKPVVMMGLRLRALGHNEHLVGVELNPGPGISDKTVVRGLFKKYGEGVLKLMQDTKSWQVMMLLPEPVLKTLPFKISASGWRYYEWEGNIVSPMTSIIEYWPSQQELVQYVKERMQGWQVISALVGHHKVVYIRAPVNNEHLVGIETNPGPVDSAKDFCQRLLKMPLEAQVIALEKEMPSLLTKSKPLQSEYWHLIQKRFPLDTLGRLSIVAKAQYDELGIVHTGWDYLSETEFMNLQPGPSSKTSGMKLLPTLEQLDSSSELSHTTQQSRRKRTSKKRVSSINESWSSTRKRDAALMPSSASIDEWRDSGWEPRIPSRLGGKNRTEWEKKLDGECEVFPRPNNCRSLNKSSSSMSVISSTDTQISKDISPKALQPYTQQTLIDGVASWLRWRRINSVIMKVSAVWAGMRLAQHGVDWWWISSPHWHLREIKFNVSSPWLQSISNRLGIVCQSAIIQTVRIPIARSKGLFDDWVKEYVTMMTTQHLAPKIVVAQPQSVVQTMVATARAIGWDKPWKTLCCVVEEAKKTWSANMTLKSVPVGMTSQQIHESRMEFSEYQSLIQSLITPKKILVTVGLLVIAGAMYHQLQVYPVKVKAQLESNPAVKELATHLKASSLFTSRTPASATAQKYKAEQVMKQALEKKKDFPNLSKVEGVEEKFDVITAAMALSLLPSDEERTLMAILETNRSALWKANNYVTRGWFETIPIVSWFFKAPV